MLQIVLASESPRRRELLKSAGFQFHVSPVKVSEIFSENLNPGENASHLATVKAEACFNQSNHLKSKDFLILAADTIVSTGDQILGKPKDAAEAIQFLRLLSGKTHRVITGVALFNCATGERWTGRDCTEVEFKNLSEGQIKTYVETGEPMDKAGAYAIQGGAREFVAEYRGSWSNVVGLPLELLESTLKEKGWSVGRN
ncbi:MAG: nucleoside triphosphate pyrophosphatase [Bdellovibrionales bacterium]